MLILTFTLYPPTYLIIVLWEAVIVGRDGRDKLGTGVSKHVLKDLLLSLLQSKIIQYFMLTLHITATYNILCSMLFLSALGLSTYIATLSKTEIGTRSLKVWHFWSKEGALLKNWNKMAKFVVNII